MDHRKLSIGLGLVVAFLAGCVLQQTLGVAVPAARAGTAPARWEYACVNVAERVSETMNKFGAQGWELAAASGLAWGSGLFKERDMIWCFKRPLG
ncbi:MAG TPA: hypothetical protein VK601_31135 [Kofleriaceae bacterium]|nr:hypothetical protein [Kofleriaceae bacterium]